MTIKLEISDYSSGDIDEVWNWQPSDNNIYFQLSIEIGEKGEAGGNFFELIVTTPQGMEKRHVGELKEEYEKSLKGYEGLAKNGLLVLDEYSWENLENRLNEIVKSCERDTWQDSINELRKQFFWEYENDQWGLEEDS